MDLKKKLKLSNVVESYCDMLPPEIKEIKESQELIEWRESFVSRKLCVHIEAYGQLRLVWFIGLIQCKPRIPKGCECRPRCFCMKIYSHFWDLDGVRRKVFLDYSFCGAMPRCYFVKNGLGYQTNPSHSISVCGMKLSL